MYLGAGEYIWSSLYIFSLSYEQYGNYTKFYLNYKLGREKHDDELIFSTSIDWF
jgi:hypothetical protein